MAATDSKREFDGGCLCGAVRFRVAGELRDVVYCHCEQCRRTSGHFVAATRAEDSDITVTADTGLRWFASSKTAKRGFCEHCGSSLFWKQLGSDRISIMAGAIDDKTALSADRHIFTADKADYYDLNDGLLQFEAAD